MPMIELPDVWTNPFQRFGIIDVNVTIGKYVRDGDFDLFFGPLSGLEVFFHWNRDDIQLPKMLSVLRLFPSAKEATRRGYTGPIPEGFTDMIVKAALKNTVNREHRGNDSEDHEGGAR
jgi:hypothetical protein